MLLTSAAVPAGLRFRFRLQHLTGAIEVLVRSTLWVCALSSGLGFLVEPALTNTTGPPLWPKRCRSFVELTLRIEAQFPWELATCLSSPVIPYGTRVTFLEGPAWAFPLPVNINPVG